MKNLLFLLTAILLISVEMNAQSVPEGMRFQAIARNLDGSLLTLKTLIVQVELMSAGTNERIFYSETHDVRSSDLGLLDFVIGEGALSSGKFSEIPWSSEEMWVRISMKTQADENYQIISSGQLYSVPYAQYATSAGQLNKESGSGNRTPGTGMNSINWTLEGNYNSQNRNDGNPVLGTTDANDLVIVTNNIPRLIIDANGMINFMVDVDVAGELNVDGATTLNGSLDVTNMSATHLSGTLTVDKVTTLNDQLTVTNMASTHLTGSLDVDKTLNGDGATTLNNTLDVTGTSASHLSGQLSVDEATTLNDAMTVANTSSSHLTGSLDVDKTMNVDEASTLNNSLDVTGMHATTLTGTLTVDNATTLNALTVANISPTHLTGSLDVDKTMNVDGATALNGTLNVTGISATTLTGSLTVDKVTTLNDDLTVASSAPTHLTGSLTVDGALNAGGAISLDGALNVTGMNPTTLSGTLEVDKLATFEAGVKVSGSGDVGPGSSALAFFDNSEGGSSDGIAIKINHSEPSKENNFITFYRGNGSTIAGRIEGYQIDDIADVPLPTSEEIWGVVCIGLADYNPITIAWTQFASAFNLVSYGWNNTSIPTFDIPDIPAFTITDVPALTIPDVPAFVIDDVPGFVIDDIPGIVIPDIEELTVGPYLCVDVTVCICPCLDFSWTCCCATVNECLIPEFELFTGIELPDFPGIEIPDFPGIVVPDFPGIATPNFPGIPIPDFPGLVIPAVPAITFAAFGAAPTIPTFSDILVEQGVCPDVDLYDFATGYVPRLVNWATEHRLTSLVTLDPLKLAAQGLAWGLTTAAMNDGVVYGSEGADYAEYLPKLYENEKFLKGDIIGVYNGKISKNTKNADQILAITSQPLVLGNMPDDTDAAGFEKVAFLGQIPVYVNGPVKLGDYIVPSGNNDGIANAISPELVTTEMLSTILGQAWSDYTGVGVTLINTSIGLRPMEIANVLKQQGDLEQKLQEEIQMQRDNTEVLSNDIEQMKNKLGLLPLTSYNP